MSASTNAMTGPDAAVVVKVNFEGITRRAKMHLREMVPRVLEEQVRSFLLIPPNVETVIERYSDSASTYVVLEPANMAIYKQLYRAAKAKSKLKLRVSIKGQPEKIIPKPASVEDEAEIDAAPNKENKPVEVKPATPTAEAPVAPSQPSPAPLPGFPTQVTLPVRVPNPSNPSGQITAAANFPEVTRPIEQQRSSHVTEQQRRLRELIRRSNELANRYQEQQRSASSLGLPIPREPGIAPAYPPRVPASTPRSAAVPALNSSFAVCCNTCKKTIPGSHYHCSTCDDGDFDLCQPCVDRGTTCYSNAHWLIKRSIVNGQVVNSTTETIPPKPKPKSAASVPLPPPVPRPVPVTVPRPMPAPVPAPAPAPAPATVPVTVTRNSTRVQLPVPRPVPQAYGTLPSRTCNSCVEELPAREFLHCTICEDFDLCQSCFAKGGHGHHPMHPFAPAVAGTVLPMHIKVKLAPGRNQLHHALCDGCDKFISGVRHKCLDCPDWDYCSDCVVNAKFVHEKHRFVPIYEPLEETVASASPPIHHGIWCDGPLCSLGMIIRGTRYKCAVCHDVDFCGNCESSPANPHNATHPLIRFKTPVRHVSVSTTGEHQDGRKMPQMGDRGSTDSKATETVSPVEGNAMNAVQTVVDVKPAESSLKAVEPEIQEPEVEEPEPEVKEEEQEQDPQPEEKEVELQAVFVKDTVADGTILPPNHGFEQTWTLRNESEVAWPAGCSVKFVGGDYMGHVDSTHPAGVPELISASESTVCYSPLNPGQQFPFTVLLRTPTRPGKIISYWRLTTPEGLKFGHRLWCEVNVRDVSVESLARPASEEEEEEEEEEQADEQTESTMIFPKLDKESPVSSMHEPTQSDKDGQSDDFEDCAEDDEWEESDEGFLTDEEYDILDASDEEYLEEQEKKLLQK